MTRAEKIILICLLTGQRGEVWDDKALSRLLRRRLVEPVRRAAPWRRRTLTTYHLTALGTRAAVRVQRHLDPVRANPRRFVRNRGPVALDTIVDRYNQRVLIDAQAQP